MARDTIFICHATPDDNDFVRWLGARLTGHGYKVWADMFGLKGGTPFWNTIEDALREQACKVIYVASKASVDPTRQGVRNELSVADAVRKVLNDPAFIIPVRLDAVAFADFPILVHQLNALDFSQGWGKRLIELLDTLETYRKKKQVKILEGARASLSEILKISNTPIMTTMVLDSIWT